MPDLLRSFQRCWDSLVEYGDLKDCKVIRSRNACQTELSAYVGCMEVNTGKRPGSYEVEWCASERQLYKLCREERGGADSEAEPE